MTNKNIAEELLAETRSPQDAYKCAIRRERRIQNSELMKTNPFGSSQTSSTIEQESMGYIQGSVRGRRNGYQNNQRNRGFGRGRQQMLRGSSDEEVHKTNRETKTIHVTSVADSLDPSIYNRAQLKTKFA